MRRSLIILCSMLFCLSASMADAATLRSPFPALPAPASNPKGEIFECGPAPAAFVDLNIGTIYKSTDPTESIPDPAAEKLYRNQVKPLNAYLDQVAQMANIYTRSKSRNLSSAKCALSWLNEWAQDEALVKNGSRYGNFIRAWSLAAISSAYIQIAYDGRLDPEQKVAVKKWLLRLNKTVIKDYSKPADTTAPKNNHLYWAAWAVGITSTVLQHPDSFSWAMKQAKTGLIQIEDDGTLPREVRRASRAQTYHLFAAIPLVMLAELGAANNVDLYSYNDDALHKLVALNIKEFYNPEYLLHRSGAKQKLDKPMIPNLLCWIEPYNKRFGFADPEARKSVDKILMTYRPLGDRRAGGDTTLLFGTK